MDAMNPQAAPSEVRKLLHDHLFDLAPIMMAVLDPQYRIVDANAAFGKMLGPWEGRHCYELLKGRLY